MAVYTAKPVQSPQPELHAVSWVARLATLNRRVTVEASGPTADASWFDDSWWDQTYLSHSTHHHRSWIQNLRRGSRRGLLGRFQYLQTAGTTRFCWCTGVTLGRASRDTSRMRPGLNSPNYLGTPLSPRQEGPTLRQQGAARILGEAFQGMEVKAARPV